MILAPLVRGRKGEFKKEIDGLRQGGYSRARIDGEMTSLDEEIKLDNTNTVGGIREFEVQCLGIIFSLRQSLARLFIVGFGLDNRNREIAGISQQIICFFCLPRLGVPRTKNTRPSVKMRSSAME